MIVPKRIAALGSILFSLLSFSQNYTSNQEERPTATAVSITTEPDIDGEVLNDEIWQQIQYSL